jgi:hypothetical protein
MPNGVALPDSPEPGADRRRDIAGISGPVLMMHEGNPGKSGSQAPDEERAPKMRAHQIGSISPQCYQILCQ